MYLRVRKANKTNGVIEMKQWSVIKFNTKNGQRIGITNNTEIGIDIEVLANDLGVMEVTKLCRAYSCQLNIPEVDNTVDL